MTRKPKSFLQYGPISSYVRQKQNELMQKTFKFTMPQLLKPRVHLKQTLFATILCIPTNGSNVRPFMAPCACFPSVCEFTVNPTIYSFHATPRNVAASMRDLRRHLPAWRIQIQVKILLEVRSQRPVENEYQTCACKLNLPLGLLTSNQSHIQTRQAIEQICK